MFRRILPPLTRLGGALVCFLWVAGCATTAPPGDPEGFFARASVRDGATGAPLTLAATEQRLLEARVLYVAEQHDSEAHHRAQRTIATRLAASRPLVIGFEMVERPNQVHLDAYCRSEIDDDGLREALNWSKSWGFSWEWYQPLFELGKRDTVELVALSPPISQVRSVARKGPEATPDLPDLTRTDESHRTYVLRALGAHGHHGKMNPEWFYLAQLTRDATMADTMAATLTKRPAALGVVIAGRGHIEHGHGIPRLLHSQLAGHHVIVMPIGAGEWPEYEDSLSSEGFPSRRADLFWEDAP